MLGDALEAITAGHDASTAGAEPPEAPATQQTPLQASQQQEDTTGVRWQEQMALLWRASHPATNPAGEALFDSQLDQAHRSKMELGDLQAAGELLVSAAKGLDMAMADYSTRLPRQQLAGIAQDSREPENEVPAYWLLLQAVLARDQTRTREPARQRLLEAAARWSAAAAAWDRELLTAQVQYASPHPAAAAFPHELRQWLTLHTMPTLIEWKEQVWTTSQADGTIVADEKQLAIARMYRNPSRRWDYALTQLALEHAAFQAFLQQPSLDNVPPRTAGRGRYAALYMLVTEQLREMSAAHVSFPTNSPMSKVAVGSLRSVAAVQGRAAQRTWAAFFAELAPEMDKHQRRRGATKSVIDHTLAALNAVRRLSAIVLQRTAATAAMGSGQGDQTTARANSDTATITAGPVSGSLASPEDPNRVAPRPPAAQARTSPIVVSHTLIGQASQTAPGTTATAVPHRGRAEQAAAAATIQDLAQQTLQECITEANAELRNRDPNGARYGPRQVAHLAEGSPTTFQSQLQTAAAIPPPAAPPPGGMHPIGIPQVQPAGHSGPVGGLPPTVQQNLPGGITGIIPDSTTTFSGTVSQGFQSGQAAPLQAHPQAQNPITQAPVAQLAASDHHLRSSHGVSTYHTAGSNSGSDGSATPSATAYLNTGGFFHAAATRPVDIPPADVHRKLAELQPPQAAQDAIEQLHFLIARAGPVSPDRQRMHRLIVFLHGIQPPSDSMVLSSLQSLLTQHETRVQERKLAALVPKVMKSAAALTQSLRMYAQRITVVKQIVPYAWAECREDLSKREEQLLAFRRLVERYEFSSLITCVTNEVDALTFGETEGNVDDYPGIRLKKRKTTSGKEGAPPPKPAPKA